MKEMWDERFAGEEYAYGTLPILFFKERIEGLHPGKLPGSCFSDQVIWKETNKLN